MKGGGDPSKKKDEEEPEVPKSEEINDPIKGTGPDYTADYDYQKYRAILKKESKMNNPRFYFQRRVKGSDKTNWWQINLMQAELYVVASPFSYFSNDRPALFREIDHLGGQEGGRYLMHRLASMRKSASQEEERLTAIGEWSEGAQKRAEAQRSGYHY